LFGEFRDAIENYCQNDRLYYDHHGNATLVPGLSELPFNICGFIEDTIDQILVPFSGPAGDYESAQCTSSTTIHLCTGVCLFWLQKGAWAQDGDGFFSQWNEHMFWNGIGSAE